MPKIKDFRTIAGEVLNTFLWSVNELPDSRLRDKMVTAMNEHKKDFDAACTGPVVIAGGVSGYFQHLRETQPYDLTFDDGSTEEVLGLAALALRLNMVESAVKRRINQGRGVFTMATPPTKGLNHIGGSLTITRRARV